MDEHVVINMLFSVFNELYRNLNHVTMSHHVSFNCCVLSNSRCRCTQKLFSVFITDVVEYWSVAVSIWSVLTYCTVRESDINKMNMLASCRTTHLNLLPEYITWLSSADSIATFSDC